VLRQSEEVAGIGSWEYDIDTGNFHWSQGMYRLFGLPQGSPVTPDIYLDHVIAADCPVAQKIIYHLTGSHQPLEETLRIEAREKELTLKIKIIALHDEQGIPIKMLGVGVDISEFKRLEQENLQIRLRQQKQLMNAILDAQGEEQRRISESLHNGVGQILYATKLNLELVDLDMLPVHKEQINRALNVTRDLLTKAIKETRRVSHELVPILLKEFGLEIAIKDFVKHFSAGAIRLRYEVEGMSERLDSYLELALFRISQELVNNIVKHSGATEATLFLKKMESEVLLEVKDNGKGFEPGKTTTRGLGLRSMEDRVKLLNGTWQVDTHPGAGVKISIRIPVISYSV
jgi:signal transduction histidine kinase